MNEQQIPDLPPPSSHPEVNLTENWKTTTEYVGYTVYGLSWHEEYLVGCTSSGTILLWHIPFDDTNKNDKDSTDIDRWSFDRRYDSDDDDDEKKQELPNDDDNPKLMKPIFQFRADDDGILYSIKFLYMQQKIFLGVSGETGILLYSWDDILRALEKTERILLLKAKHRFRPQVGKYEFNDFDYDADDNIFGASEFGYKWNIDTGKLVATFDGRKRHDSYLHTVRVLPPFQGGHSVALMGGEDGILGVWDHKSHRVIEEIDIKSKMNEGADSLHSYANNDNNKSSFTPWEKQSNLWISHVESSESSVWWNACGGVDDAGGHLTCWHAPTRSLVSGCALRETPHRVARNSSSNIINTVGNESVVSYWSATQVNQERRCWTTVPCSYALAIRKEDGLTAVGGAGTQIDILEENGTKRCSISAIL